MIIGFFGDLGSGKTLSAVKLLSQLYGKGYRVYSNTPVSFPYTYLTIDFMLEIVEGSVHLPPKSVFFVDEIVLYLDSRSSGTSKVNRILSYFLLQTRKLGHVDYGLYFIYSTQFPRLIDIRLWEVTTMKVVCNKDEFQNEKIILNTWIIEKITGTITIQERFLAKKYYKYYDTKQIIKMPKSKYDRNY